MDIFLLMIVSLQPTQFMFWVHYPYDDCGWESLGGFLLWIMCVHYSVVFVTCKKTEEEDGGGGGGGLL